MEESHSHLLPPRTRQTRNSVQTDGSRQAGDALQQFAVCERWLVAITQREAKWAVITEGNHAACCSHEQSRLSSTRICAYISAGLSSVSLHTRLPLRALYQKRNKGVVTWNCSRHARIGKRSLGFKLTFSPGSPGSPCIQFTQQHQHTLSFHTLTHSSIFIIKMAPL